MTDLTSKELDLLKKFFEHDEMSRSSTGDRESFQYISVDQTTVLHLGGESTDASPSILNTLLEAKLIRITDGSGSFSKGAGTFSISDEGRALAQRS